MFLSNTQKWRRSCTVACSEVAILLPGEVNVNGGTCIAKAKTSNIASSNNLKAKSLACEIMIAKKKKRPLTSVFSLC